MTFYLKPVQGTISTNLFHAYSECRLKYLLSLRLSKSSDSSAKVYETSFEAFLNSDCLIEGTSKDRVSHFALLSVSTLYPPLHSFIIKKEQLLFQRRLAKMKYSDLKLSVIMLMKHIKEYQSTESESSYFQSYLQQTETVLLTILKKRLLSYINFEPKDPSTTASVLFPKDDGKCIFSVPFRHVLHLISVRDVILRDGLAHLRCDQLSVYLSEVFSKLIIYNSCKIQQVETFEKIKHDSRFNDLLTILKLMYHTALPIKKIPQSSKALRLTKLDEFSKYFPPCMRALHLTLRKRHRLCHRPRVQYTLYLKEIGLSVEDCIELIRSEYSRPPNMQEDQKHICEHSWSKDNRRYMYGTRHLYGLEGCRTNYSAHTCQSIQKEVPAANSCGGCPFSHYDKNKLKTLLAEDLGGKESEENFSSQCESGKTLPIESCHLHLRFKAKFLSAGKDVNLSQVMQNYENSQVQIYNVFKPKDYFALMTKVMGLE